MAVDRHELRALIHDLGEIPPAVRRELRPALMRAGEPVLGQMRSNSSWSNRIPGAIYMRPASSSPGVTFRVDSGRAPHARPYENGGVRNGPDYFRHPVYGDRENWVSQKTRPFFFRALEQRADDVVNAIGDVVTEVAARHGF